MADKTEETTDPHVGHDSPLSGKKNGRASLLDSGEDFEVLDEDDTGDDLPPLEDTGGGKNRSKDESQKQNSDTDSEPPNPLGEWLDVLGMDHAR